MLGLVCASIIGYTLPGARCPSPVARSSDRPACAGLPSGVASVDDITPAMLKGYDRSDLEAAMENLEVGIFDAPPFDKVNEQVRRRNLAITYWLMDDPAFYPRMIPNAKEALRQVKGEDAELQYMIGSAMLSCMESGASQEFAINSLKKAIELQPDFPEAIEALAAATGAPAGAPPPTPAAPPPSEAATKEKEAPEATAQKGSPAQAQEAAPPAGFEWGLTL